MTIYLIIIFSYIENMRITEHKNKKSDKLSGGTKRKVIIIELSDNCMKCWFQLIVVLFDGTLGSTQTSLIG